MFTSKFSQIRNSMHTFSHAPLAKGQKWIDQATAPAGHNIGIDNVRAESIPAIATLAERDSQYLVVKNGKRIVGGTKGSNFTNIIRFLDRCEIVEIPNTNGESYVVVDEEGNHLAGFIDPADKPINQYTLSEGYELLMYAEDGSTKISRNIGWTFDSFNGIIHFEKKNPKSIDWEFGSPKIEGFIYIGQKVSGLMDDFAASISSTDDKLEEMKNSAIAVQPFKFSTVQMTTIGDPYPLENSHMPDLDYFQCLSIIIPGYVFELISLDDDETVITEMRHLPSGDTQIFLNLPWNLQYECPIMSYQYDSGVPGVGRRIPVIGKYKFIAMTFVTNNGERIPMRPMKDFENPENEAELIPIPLGYELSTPFEPGTPISLLSSAPHPQRSYGYPGGFYYSDDDTIINVFNSR